MSHDDMDNYRAVLSHIVRPEKPSERQMVDSIKLRDYQALYLYDGLVEYAAYAAETADEEQIALGYAEYINMVVREEGKNIVKLYVHTETAYDVLSDAVASISQQTETLHQNVVRSIEIYE